MTRDKSPLAGKTITIKSGKFAGLEITIEDWWENVHGESWMAWGFQPVAVIQYVARVHVDKLPVDDDVLYGKIGNAGYLVHLSELDGDKDHA